MYLKRIEKELKEFHDNCEKEEFDGIFAGPVDDSNMLEWEASITGPEESPYEGGNFNLRIFFPRDYPFRPFKVIFDTKIFHPNFSQYEGRNICCHSLSYLGDGWSWSPDITISKLLKDIQDLLKNPDPDTGCVNLEAAKLYKKDRYKFYQIAKEWTDKYAIE